MTTPSQAASTIVAALRRAANRRVARSLTRFFKPDEPVRFYGVPTRRLRQIVREATRRLDSRWSLREAVACADLLLAHPVMEARVAGIEVLGRFRRRFSPRLLEVVARWIRRGSVNNWALVDALALAVLAPVASQHPATWSRIARWVRGRSRWMRRAAAVAFVPLARTGARDGLRRRGRSRSHRRRLVAKGGGLAAARGRYERPTAAREVSP